MKPITVLVTAAGAPGGPGIIAAFKKVTERAVRTVGIDANPQASGLFLAAEGHVVPEAANEAAYLEAVRSIVKTSGVDVILPLSGTELVALASHADSMGALVAANRAEALEIALDKRRTYEFLAGSAVAIPQYRLVNAWDDFLAAVYELGYPDVPVCFKPAVSKGQRGFRVLQRDADLRRLLLDTKPDSTVTTLELIEPILSKGIDRDLLVSEYLPGMEYTVDSLADAGRTLVAIPRRRSVTKLGISNVGTVEDNDEMIEAAREINRLFGFSYNINVQLKYAADGIPKLVEINPRVSGTIVLSVESGPNLPYLAVKQVLGEPIEIPPVAWGTTMIRYWSEIYTKQPA